ncbi:hypothetical protein BC834DRAFT_869809 [Gloeopeniophorella convolvens]|nr:hypothetical protein BC834DRAFT_869809 [Gloeopeniophorella convolvens]
MSDRTLFHLDIECKALDWQVSALAQICASLHHTILSTMERLIISLENLARSATPVPEPGQDEPEPEQWLELLRPFNTIENLWLKDPGVSSGFCQALRTLPSGGEGALHLLPALRELVLMAASGEQSRALVQVLDPFVEARRLADRPLTVSYYGG